MMGDLPSLGVTDYETTGGNYCIFRLPATEKALSYDFSFVVNIGILIEVDNLTLVERSIHAIKACPDDAAHPLRLFLIGQGNEHISSAKEAQLNDAEVVCMPRIFNFDLVETINITFLESIHGQLGLYLHPLCKLCIFKIDVSLVDNFYSVRIGLDAVLVNCKRSLSFCFILWQSSHFFLNPQLLVPLLILHLLKSDLLISLLLDLLLFKLKLLPLKLQLFLLQFLPVKNLVILLPIKTYLLAYHLLLDVHIIWSYLILPLFLYLGIVLRPLVWLNGRQTDETTIFIILIRDIPDNDLLTNTAGTCASGRADYYRPAASQHASGGTDTDSSVHHAVAHAEAAHTHHTSVHHPHSHVHLHCSHSHVPGPHPHHFGSQKWTSHGHVHCSHPHIHCSDSHVHRAHVHHSSSEGHVHSKHSILLMQMQIKEFITQMSMDQSRHINLINDFNGSDGLLLAYGSIFLHVWPRAINDP